MVGSMGKHGGEMGKHGGEIGKHGGGVNGQKHISHPTL